MIQHYLRSANLECQQEYKYDVIKINYIEAWLDELQRPLVFLQTIMIIQNNNKQRTQKTA